MASTLASQLQRISATSTSTLSSKRVKAQHAVSLLWPSQTAAAQDWAFLYSVCVQEDGGFNDLLNLDPRFGVFLKGIFSESSKDVDRNTMTKAENDDLDSNCKAFLELVGPWARLKPALKAIEWLVRRFRIHYHIPTQLLLTFLPHHNQPIFLVVLSIIPDSAFPTPFGFLRSYTKSQTTPPRSLFTHALATRPDFFGLVSEHIIKAKRYPLLTKFWASISAEAAAIMCDRTRSTSSKKTSSTSETEEDIMTKFLPILAEGLKAKRDHDFQLACYMITTVLAAKLYGLEERVLSKLSEAVINGWTEETLGEGLACVGLLVQEGARLSADSIQKLLLVENIGSKLAVLSTKIRADRLATALAVNIIDKIEQRTVKDIALLETILADVRLTVKQKKAIFGRLANCAGNKEMNDVPELSARFADMVVGLGEGSVGGRKGKKKLAALFHQTLQEQNVDVEALELKIGSVIRPVVLSAAKTGGEEAAEATQVVTPTFESALQRLPDSSSEATFLSSSADSLFALVSDAFTLSLSSSENVDSIFAHKLFSSHPGKEAFTLSFLVRLWCGVHPTLARAAAVAQCSSLIEKHAEADKSEKTDYQALIPYALLALSDNTKKVRTEAARLITVLGKSFERFDKKGKKSGAVQLWADGSLYGNSQSKEELKFAPSEDVSKFLSHTFLNKMEECLMDATVTRRLLRDALSSSKQLDVSDGPSALKKSVRSNILGMLCSHAVLTTSFRIKLGLLQLVNTVEKAPTSRTVFLLPLLKDWALCTNFVERNKACLAEKVEPDDMDKEVAAIVSEGDKSNGTLTLVEVLNTPRISPSIQSHASLRLQKIWTSLKSTVRVSLSQELLKVAFSVDDQNETGIGEAQRLFRDLNIPREAYAIILNDLLQELKGDGGKFESAGDTKRRRVGFADKEVKQQIIAEVVRKVTTVLESLVSSRVDSEDGSLVGLLFNILHTILDLSEELGVRISYVASILLDCLLQMFTQLKKTAIPPEVITQVRTDSLIRCIQANMSPQVHNSALLIVAALADVVPDSVLHSVMPIFTFIGGSVLARDDDYSVHVIEQTVKRVFPPLLKSLQAQGGSLVVGAAELLASFVGAYVHVPVHRRLWLYTSLVETLGPNDFLFAIVAMMAERYGAPTEEEEESSRAKQYKVSAFRNFCAELVGAFSPQVQMATVNSYLDVVIDALQPAPNGVCQQLFDPRNTGQIQLLPEETAEKLLGVLAEIISGESLKSQVAQALKQQSRSSAELRESFTVSLEKFLALAERNSESVVSESIQKTLSGFLGILETAEFVRLIESLLVKDHSELRQSALGALRERLLSEHRLDSSTRSSIISLTPKISSIITSDASLHLKSQALLCVHAVVKKCGRQEPGVVSDLTTVIAGAGSLKSNEEPLQVASLVCLASITDCLGGRFVPFIPQTVPFSLQLLVDSDSSELFAATFAFMDELYRTIPSFMVPYLSNIIELSGKATTLDLSEDVDETKSDLLDTIAEKADLKEVLRVISENWDQTVLFGKDALLEQLQLLRKVVVNSSKGPIQKLHVQITHFFMKALDLRRVSQLGDADLFSVEKLMVDVVLQIVYKLNDVIFKPMFLSFLEWAAEEARKEPAGREKRLTTFWHLVYTLSDSLKSLFTDYFGLVLNNVVEVLKDIASKGEGDDSDGSMWNWMMKALTSGFVHDERDFWQLHFQDIAPAILDTIVISPSKTVPALLELLAIAQSEDNFKSVNSYMLKLMKNDEDTKARVAGTRALADIYGRLGEEWIGLLPETVPVLAEVLEDDDEEVERTVKSLVRNVEKVLGEGELESMLT